MVLTMTSMHTYAQNEEQMTVVSGRLWQPMATLIGFDFYLVRFIFKN